MGWSISLMLVLVVTSMTASAFAITVGTATQILSFSVPKSPSGMHYFAKQDLLWIICGTNTNGDHYLYAYTTSGSQKCAITIPASVGMSRVDGFEISADGTTAYIVDSQGPIYAATAGMLGGSIYSMPWTNPCACTWQACSNSIVTWTPTITSKITIDPTVASIGDGGGVDNYFRNSGIVISGAYAYAINGVHPVTQNVYDAYYPKSLVKVALSDTASKATAVSKWSFSKAQLGRNVDMEGLTCGADNCTKYMYIGDEYNYVREKWGKDGSLLLRYTIYLSSVGMK